MIDEGIHYRYGVASTIPEIDSLDVVSTLLEHESCRSFQLKPVSDKLKTLIYAAGQSAPSKSNLQQYSLIDVTDPLQLEHLCEQFPTVNWAFTAPWVVLILGDTYRNRQINAVKGYSFQWNDEDAFLNAAVDSALVMGAMITAAEGIGLGACPISKIREQSGWIADQFNLPGGVFPVCACAFGYPASNTKNISPRLPQSIVVHVNKYQPLNLDLIDEYDRTFNKIMGPPKPRYIERYGVPEESTWSENVGRQTSVDERPDFKTLYTKTQLFKP